MKARRALLGLAVSAVFLLIFARGVDWHAVRQALAGARYGYLVLASLLFTVVTGLQAYRWKILLDRFGSAGTRESYQVLLIGHAANTVLPLRLGDVIRAFLARSRFGVRRSAALGTVLLERILDGVVLVILFALSLIMAHSLGRLGSLLIAAAALFAVLVALLALAAALGQHHVPRLLSLVVPAEGLRLSFRGRTAAFTHERIHSSVSQVIEGVASAADRRRGGLAILSTFLFWLGMVLVYYTAALAFELPRSPVLYGVVVGAANLALAVPSSPSGLGPFDYFAREALLLQATSSSEATAYVLALHLALAIPLFVLGLVFAWMSGMSLLGTARIASKVQPAEAIIRE